MNRSILFAALLLSGCITVGPDYQRPATGLPAVFGEPAVGSTAATVPQQWGALYNDATLVELGRAGPEANADVRLARARAAEAEGLLREAHATPYFPPIPGNAGPSRAPTLQ